MYEERGSRRIMGGSGSLLTFIIPHSRTICKSASQNVLWSSVQWAVTQKRLMLSQKSMGNSGKQRVVRLFTAQLLGAFIC